MHGPINVKSPNNTSKWQMGFNSAFKGLMYSTYYCIFPYPFSTFLVIFFFCVSHFKFTFYHYILCFSTYMVLVQLAVLLLAVPSLIFNHLFKSSLLTLCRSLRLHAT
jgi:hypothetical protein